MKIPVLRSIVTLVLLAGCASRHETARTAAAKTAQANYPYTKPLTSPGGKFGMLPPVVQNTVRAEAGAAEVLDGIQDTSSGRVAYKTFLRHSPTLYRAPDRRLHYPH